MTASDPKVIVKAPAVHGVRRTIDLVAKFVATDGEAFEQVWNRISARVCIRVRLELGLNGR